MCFYTLDTIPSPSNITNINIIRRAPDTGFLLHRETDDASPAGAGYDATEANHGELTLVETIIAGIVIAAAAKAIDEGVEYLKKRTDFPPCEVVSSRDHFKSELQSMHV